jgi:hypothetical protein
MASAKGAKLGGRGAATPKDPASSMCDPCREAFAKTKDAERPCDRPGCTGTWTWTVTQQMEAFATKRPPPSGLCADDEAKLAALSDKPVPCAVPGCTRTSTFSRRAQLIAGAPDVEPPLPTQRCGQCEGVFRKLKDRPVRCGINGCDKKWSWSALEQIEAYASGLTNDPPRRMCDRCKTDLDAQRPAGRVPRRQAGAQGPAPDVRELQRDLPDVAGRRAALPPRRLQGRLDRQARRAARARGAREDGRSVSAVLRGLLEEHRRSRGPADRLQDRQLHGHVDLDEGRAARGGSAP